MGRAENGAKDTKKSVVKNAVKRKKIEKERGREAEADRERERGEQT